MRVDVVPASGKAVLHAAAAKPCVSRPEVSTDPIAKEILQITDELRQRLDRHTLSRKVFPHLAVLERELKRSGYRSLSTLPPELLDAALGQLVFITGRIPGELCTLRAKVLEAIFARAPAAGDLGGQMARSMFDAPDEVQVSDATESAFFHAEEEWAASRISARPHRSDPFRRRTFAMPFSPTSGDYTEATP